MPVLAVPSTVAHCPYCGGTIWAEVREWELETGRVLEVMPYCHDEVEMEQEGRESTAYHEYAYDPDWLKVCERVDNWAKMQKVEEPS